MELGTLNQKASQSGKRNNLPESRKSCQTAESLSSVPTKEWDSRRDSCEELILGNLAKDETKPELILADNSNIGLSASTKTPPTNLITRQIDEDIKQKYVANTSCHFSKTRIVADSECEMDWET